MEMWCELWSEWNDLAWEASDESGNYIIQDYDWKQPYFDGSLLAADLEKVAEKMLLMIDDVFALKEEDDNIYLQACMEIESNIRLLPDWMAADQDSFTLDPISTACVLKWEWLVSKQVQDTAVKFVERIVEYEEQLKIVGLDIRSILDFLLSLPQNVQRRIYDYVTSVPREGKWKKRLNDVNSVWHRIYRDSTKIDN
ncbi:hypothetical protein JW998_10435 [candidate division KSB1 bacterium]|nr:hypothetical protein [candidate division KSB1 bacterium]